MMGNDCCKLNEQSGLWETEDSPLVLPSSLVNTIFFLFLHSFMHHGACKMIQIINKHWWEDFYKTAKIGASLVAQWLRVRLPMQGTRVRAPVREDPTCRGAAGPVSHGR